MEAELGSEKLVMEPQRKSVTNDGEIRPRKILLGKRKSW